MCQGQTYQNIEWINEPGHSAKHSGCKITESGDKAAIMAKYGAKFKAAFGGKPKAVPTAKKPAASAPAAKSAPAARPAPKAPQPKPAPAAYADGVDGANAVWDAFEGANKDVKQAELEERWFEAIDRHSDGKDQADMTGDQWAKVAAELRDGELPF